MRDCQLQLKKRIQNEVLACFLYDDSHSCSTCFHIHLQPSHTYLLLRIDATLRKRNHSNAKEHHKHTSHV